MKPIHLSKFLSLLLRHRPEKLGLELDKNGWASVDEIIAKMNQKGMNVDLEKIREVVANCNKQRFKLDEEQMRIRANQGHSIAVDIELKQSTPPSTLYHGTAQRFRSAIFEQGIQKQNRQHVHLSADIETASNVGRRHGEVIVLLVDAGSMHQDGIAFYLSENGVWLTDFVAPGYIQLPDLLKNNENRNQK